MWSLNKSVYPNVYLFIFLSIWHCESNINPLGTMTINGSCVFKQESRFSVWFLYRPYDVLSLCIVPYRPAQLFQRYKTAVKCGTATSHSLSLFSLLIDNNCSRNYYNYHRFVLSPFVYYIVVFYMELTVKACKCFIEWFEHIQPDPYWPFSFHCLSPFVQYSSV